MRSFRSCIGTVSPEAAARFRAFSLAMASPSKKSLRAAERKRADVARARRRWIHEQGWLDTTRLVFIDETAITTADQRSHEWRSIPGLRRAMSGTNAQAWGHCVGRQRTLP